MDQGLEGITHAVVASISSSVKTSDKSITNDARRQHECLLRLLRELEVEVIEVELDKSNDFPDVFIENTAIVCNGTALMAKPIHKEDETKIAAVRKVLESELNLRTITISDSDAKLNCSDVIFTGREFFVGISETSNESGARAVASAFPEYPCTLIKTTKMNHIKKYVTMGGPDLLCVGASDDAQQLIKRMEREATYSYQTLTLPEDEAANCLYVNGTLIHRAIEEIPESFKVFCEKIDFARRSICFSELAKSSTGLSGCCLLIRRSEI